GGPDEALCLSRGQALFHGHLEPQQLVLSFFGPLLSSSELFGGLLDLGLLSVLHLADHLLVLLELFHPLTQVLRLGVGFGDLGESTVLVERLLRGVLVTLSMRLGSRVEIVLSHFCVCAKIGRAAWTERV